MGIHSVCIQSPHTDPAVNLALEEELLEAGRMDERYFLLYANGPSIIIGKNQDPQLELSPSVLAAGIPRVYRRISGGGTVYHDLGNLNFSFIGCQQALDKECNLDLVRQALVGLGIAALANDKGDLYLFGKKISGTARCIKRRRLLQHGTLLVQADIEELRRVLSPAVRGGPGGRWGVASRPAPVTNLVKHAPGLCLADVSAGLLATVQSAWQPCRPMDWREAAAETAVMARAARYRSREWTFRPESETTGPVRAAEGARA